MTDILPALRTLLAEQPAGSGAHATLERAVEEIEHLREEHAATRQLLEERSGLLVMRVGELNQAREDHLKWCDRHSGEIQERNAHFEREVEKATGFWTAKNGALAGELRLMQARAEEAEKRAEERAAELEHLRRQVDSLQARGTELVEERRALKAQLSGQSAGVFEVRCKRTGAANLPLPVYAKPGDSGLDIRADLTWFARTTSELDERGRPALGKVARWLTEDADELELYRGERIAIGCGFAFETPPGTEWQVRPRSGHSLAGIDSILGTIDSRYRGEVVMIVINNSAWGAKIKHGMRLSQIVLAPVLQARLVEADEIGSSERGSTGLGSTGVR